MQGRKPKPNSEKIITGNPGKRPFDKTLKVSGKAPDCPSHLRGEAKRIWHKVIELLEKKDLISELDTGILAAWCVAFSTWVDASRKVQKDGAVIKIPVSTKGGAPLFGDDGEPVYQDAHNPWASVMNKQAELMAKLGDKLGLDPTSRMRLMTGEEKQPGDAAKNFLFSKPQEKPMKHEPDRVQ